MKVMLLGLPNAPSVFQSVTHGVFAALPDRTAVLSRSDCSVQQMVEDHGAQVQEVSERLRSWGLYASRERPEFYRDRCCSWVSY